jgi:hypothetical protein
MPKKNPRFGESENSWHPRDTQHRYESEREFRGIPAMKLAFRNFARNEKEIHENSALFTESHSGNTREVNYSRIRMTDDSEAAINASMRKIDASAE